MSDIFADLRIKPDATPDDVVVALRRAEAARDAAIARADTLRAERVANSINMRFEEFEENERQERIARRDAERIEHFFTALQRELPVAEKRDALREVRETVALANDRGLIFAQSWRANYAAAAATIRNLIELEAEMLARQRDAQDSIAHARFCGVPEAELPTITYHQEDLFGCTSRVMHRAIQLPGDDGRLGEGAAWLPSQPAARTWPQSKAEILAEIEASAARQEQRNATLRAEHEAEARERRVTTLARQRVEG